MTHIHATNQKTQDNQRLEALLVKILNLDNPYAFEEPEEAIEAYEKAKDDITQLIREELNK